MSVIESFVKRRQSQLDSETHWVTFFALCLGCMNRWYATAPIEVNVFKLECPECGECDSFASIMPEHYLKMWEDHEKNPES